MAFGQQSGPPATARQLRELLDLVNAAGHSDFRDARGPLGFTQRQAGGKFTRDEADAFIAQLEQENEVADDAGPVGRWVRWDRPARLARSDRRITRSDGTTQGCGRFARAATPRCVE